MRVDVVFGSASLGPGEVTGRVVAVIDVLRASTAITTALSNGARAVIPIESPDEAVIRAKTLDSSDVKLAGERRMLPIPGFDLGNSPNEFSAEAIRGKTVLITTTNGTSAIAHAAGAGARDVVVASYVNYTATLAMLRAALRGGTDVTIVCAGHDRQFSLEDSACAGRYVNSLCGQLADLTVNDAAQACALIDRQYHDLASMFDASEHGRALREAGFADDLAACAAIDAHPVIPIYQDRQITKLGPERER